MHTPPEKKPQGIWALISKEGFQNVFTIPNLITLLRILLLPFFVYFFFSEDYSLYPALAILLICGLTDLLDGYIARRFNMVSPLGQILDPLADKLAILTIFLSFLVKGYIPFWIAVIILLREGMVLLFSGILIITKTKLPTPVSSGKYAITFLYIAVVLSIFHTTLSTIALLVALLFSLWSGFNYARIAFEVFQGNGETYMF